MEKTVETQSFTIYDVCGRPLFTYACQDNSLKKTLEQAAKEEKNLSYADLRNANLQDAILDYAKLTHADFAFANLNRASLKHADLDYANFDEANLRCADLNYSNITMAIFENAHLKSSNIEWAHCDYARFLKADCRYVRFNRTSLISANFTDAILRGAIFANSVLDSAYFGSADLMHASFEDIDCTNVDFDSANLNYAFFKNVNFEGVKLDSSNISGIYISTGCYNTERLNAPMACPSDGEFIGWKKIIISKEKKEKLIKLLIPEDAKRSSASSTKCRCSKAKVLAITDIDGSNPIDEITNYNMKPTLYKVGEMVYPDSFDDYRWFECSHGIHFFINKSEAIAYAI